MYLANPVTTRALYEYEREFAMCESCFWCATVFHNGMVKEEQKECRESNSNNNSIVFPQTCPVCRNKSVSLIPLAKDEGYIISMKAKRGAEVEFSIQRG